MPHFDLSAINCFYFFLLLLGVFYAITVMIAGGLHAIHLPGLHVDLSGLHLPGAAHVDVSGMGGHDISLLSLSPISIAAFVTSFGGIGIIATQAFGADSGTSLIWSVVGSLVVALASHFAFFYLFIAPQASSALKTSDIVGQNAEVTVPIPSNSVGEVAYVSMGERHTATARSADHKEIARGALVSIEAMAGTVLIVRLK
jgi:membrane protein implicated in regulation of membrane protease activity